MVNISEVLKSINNPVRRDMLHWLKEPQHNFNLDKQLPGVDPKLDGVCVSIIQEKTGLSQSTVSSYLSNLQRANLVESKRIGSWTYYRRNDALIEQFLQELAQSL
ncbi:ArsR/SmtB family transcription factor [Ferrimonas aestuarii]|uniref:Helix-turn-helix transcriptional regulator n=1 Tax=Ferrimonas aestuarii TaxID=2569539 RepID=A0A4U1BL18_9GAMM|nr:helix-turn-helix transcriptional regulator [Ferrimonas aestuarii]TKB53355.1 helix-turn-helix transcriptional regulator [Ferrimonas aestuarii]